MFEILQKIVKKSLQNRHVTKSRRYYKKLFIINDIENRPCENEKEWMEKWAVLGMKVDVLYYRLFSHYIGNNINIVPKDICHEIIEPILNPLRYIKAYEDKNIYDRLFPKGLLPQTIFRKMNGFYYDKDYNRIQMIDDAQLIFLLDSAGFPRMIIKPTIDSSSGKGVSVIEKKNGAWFVLDKEFSKISVAFFDKNYGDNYIIQECLNQSKEMSLFCKTSVNTLRLSVYKSVKDDIGRLTGTIMRIGKDGSFVDNAHAGGCYVGITKDGNVCHEVLDQYGRKRTMFNGVDFSKDYQIPNYAAIVNFAESIVKYIPYHRLFALDIMIDDNGLPRLVEFNLRYYSMWLFQFTVGSAFGKYTDEIIDYCKGRLSNIEYTISI